MRLGRPYPTDRPTDRGVCTRHCYKDLSMMTADIVRRRAKTFRILLLLLLFEIGVHVVSFFSSTTRLFCCIRPAHPFACRRRSFHPAANPACPDAGRRLTAESRIARKDRAKPPSASSSTYWRQQAAADRSKIAIHKPIYSSPGDATAVCRRRRFSSGTAAANRVSNTLPTHRIVEIHTNVGC